MKLQQRSALRDDVRETGETPAGAGEEAQSQREQAEALSRINRRRLELINRRTLSPAEERELDELQARMSAHVNAEHPLPFAALERMEEFARRLQDRAPQDRDPK